jgi:SprT protein
MIEPINAAQQSRVVAHSLDYIERASVVYERDFPQVEIRFDLSGSSAGMFKVDRRHCFVRYNPWLFAKYFPENFEGTVPHEVAHYITHQLYGLNRIRPHGLEWREVMDAFGADPAVTCDFDLSGIPQRKQQRYTYHCDCREHELSARRHNAVRRRKSRYECMNCKTELRAKQ